MQKFGKDVCDGYYVHVFIVVFNEGSNIHQIAFPNVHHIIYRIWIACKALFHRSVKLVNVFFSSQALIFARFLFYVFAATRSIFKVEKADTLAGS